MLSQYPALPSDVRDFVNYTVLGSLKSNNQLRVNGLFNHKVIKPKKDNLWFLSWSDIIELRMAIVDENMFEVFKIVFGIDQKDFVRLEMFNAFAVYQWVSSQLTDMIKIEFQELSNDLTDEEKEAGAEELQEFGYSLTLDVLTKGDLLKSDDWLSLAYAKIFRKLCIDKKRYDINKTLQENASRKSKRNS
ncbi:hypothetical protein EV143_11821 [Flavobacterium chryseum]|uniref:hypothetical protein n=1 Tax=Flavobacterium sp. P3160 TaxID=2512113 RepID=UPI0010F04287|nr:hypothetical protein [Flavobacterium sp. P3160]TDO68837.1 hypothetical protein EV143_11821 [Flavobacterium sp. P3160]